MTTLELFATILKRLTANQNEPNSVKGALFGGLNNLIKENDFPFPVSDWPICESPSCLRGADLIDREEDEAWCDSCWEKFSAEERSNRTVRLTDLLEDLLKRGD